MAESDHLNLDFIYIRFSNFVFNFVLGIGCGGWIETCSCFCSAR